MGPQVQPKCFRYGHGKHMRNNRELRKRGYLIRFDHTEALLLKKGTLNGHFSRPAETDPYIVYNWCRKQLQGDIFIRSQIALNHWSWLNNPKEVVANTHPPKIATNTDQVTVFDPTLQQIRIRLLNSHLLGFNCWLNRFVIAKKSRAISVWRFIIWSPSGLNCREGEGKWY